MVFALVATNALGSPAAIQDVAMERWRTVAAECASRRASNDLSGASKSLADLLNQAKSAVPPGREEILRAVCREADAIASSARSAKLLPAEALASAFAVSALDALGEDEQARNRFRDAAALCAQGPPEPAVFDAIYILASYAERNGRYSDVRALLESVLAAKWPVDRSIALSGRLANTLLRLGEYGAALSRAQQVERDAGSIDSPSLRRSASILLAKIRFRLGDFATARELREKLLADMSESDVGEDRVDAINDLALALEKTGDGLAAEKRYREALSVCESLADPVREARVRVNLGRLLREDGRHDEALECQRLALARAQEARDALLEGSAMAGIAELELVRGRLDEASEMAHKSLTVFERVDAREHRLSPLRVLAHAAVEQGNTATARESIEAADALLSGRGVDALGIQDAASLRSRFADFCKLAADCGAQLAAATKTPSLNEEATVAHAWAIVDRFKARVLLDRLPGPESRGSDGDPDAWVAQLRLALEPDVAIVDYVAGRERLRAFVLTKGAAKLVELGSWASIEALSREYVVGISDRQRLFGNARLVALGRELWGALIAPVLAQLPERPRQLVISPIGALCSLPFEALVASSAGAEDSTPKLADVEFLLDRFDVTYVPSAHVASRLAGRAARERAGRVLLMGDPLFIGESEALQADAPWPTSVPRFGRLSGTRDEILDIANLIAHEDGELDSEEDRVLFAARKDRNVGETVGRLDLCLGNRAARAALFDRPLDYSLIHIATHGFIDPARSRSSGLYLAYEPRELGLLRLEDVVRLELDADLVGLSACSTAGGEALQGEGVQSLAYAFLHAGARAVLAALWDLDDAVTKDLMAKFYAGYLVERKTPAQALRDAKRTLRKSEETRGVSTVVEGKNLVEFSRGHPYFWAPVVHSGWSR